MLQGPEQVYQALNGLLNLLAKTDAGSRTTVATLATRAMLHPELIPYLKDPILPLGNEFPCLDGRFRLFWEFCREQRCQWQVAANLPRTDRDVLGETLTSLRLKWEPEAAEVRPAVGSILGSIHVTGEQRAVPCRVLVAYLKDYVPTAHRWTEPTPVRPVSGAIHSSVIVALTAALRTMEHLPRLPVHLRPAPLIYDIVGPEVTDNLLAHTSGNSLTLPFALAILSALLGEIVPTGIGATGALDAEGPLPVRIERVENVREKRLALQEISEFQTLFAPERSTRGNGLVTVPDLSQAARLTLPGIIKWEQDFVQRTQNLSDGITTGVIVCLGNADETSWNGDRDGWMRDALHLRGGMVFTPRVPPMDAEGAVWAFFDRVDRACQAVLAVHQILQFRQWRSELTVPRARIGVHYGEVEVIEGTLEGREVETTARLMEACPGGQTLLSDAAAVTLQAQTEEGRWKSEVWQVKPIGSHRLRDLHPPRLLHRLLLTSRRNRLGSPRVLEPRNHNLPMVLQPRIGREADIRTIRNILKQPHIRALTLIGNGGIGKTRLALEVGARCALDYPGGVWFISLRDVTDEDALAYAIASAMQIATPAQSTDTTWLTQALRNRRALLILDNGESALLARLKVSQILQEAPGITALITARTRLRIPEETVYEVGPLKEGTEDTRAAEALFIERARAANTRFTLTAEDRETVRRICQLLTCLPLPLEIAAAQTRYFSLAEMEQRLAASLSNGEDGGGIPALQKTVRQTIEWSFALLSAEEREMLLRLAVFQGGISPEAAKGVCPDEYGIESLIGLDEKALIYRGTDGDSERYFLLPPVQDFVLARALRDGAEHRCRVEHARYFQNFAKECAKQVTISSSPAILGLLNQEIDNIRAVVDFLESTDSAALPALISDLTEPLYLSGYIRERAKWVELALQLVENGHTKAAPAVLARLYRTRTLVLLGQDRAREAEEPIRAAVEWARSANDPTLLAATLTTTGMVERGIRRYDASIACFKEARGLYQEINSTRGEVVTLNGLITVGIRANRLDMATECCQDAIRLCRRANDRYGLTLALSNLGYITYQQSDVQKAIGFYAEALRVAEEIENAPQVGIALMNLGDIVRKHQEREVGVNLLVIAEQVLRRLGHNMAAEAEQYLNEETTRIGAEKMEAIRREYGRRTLPGLLRSRPWRSLVTHLPIPTLLS